MSASASAVIYVDLSSDSEEETPPGGKRRRLEQQLQPQHQLVGGMRKSLPAKMVTIPPKASLPGGASGVAKTMQLPSGLTVTKHHNNNNNNNVASNGGLGLQKQMQKIAWSMSSKAPSPNAQITSVPSHQVKVTPLMTKPPAVPVLQKPPPLGQRPNPPKLQKPLMVHKLPTLQKSPLANLQKTAQPLPPPPQAPKQQPPPAHLNPAPPLAKITPVNRSAASFTVKPLPAAHQQSTSAARTLPFRSKPATPPLTASTMAASATPPLRLLATPPHCAAALNEPLLLNLPPTTSITPQLTPTTTPPPATNATAVHQQQPYHHLPKGTTFKMNPLPGASISPANKTFAKRVQPITVLKKSDEEWRKHIAQQQIQQQQQQKQLREQPQATPTVVLVESPPTTPPTENDKLAMNQTKAASKATVPEKSNRKSVPKSHSFKPLPVKHLPLEKLSVPVKPLPLDNQPVKLDNSMVKPIQMPAPTNSLENSLNKSLHKPLALEKQTLPPLSLEKSFANALQKPAAMEKPEPALEKTPKPDKPAAAEKPPLVPEYAQLLQLSREVDKSKDMDRLIDTKLMKYYYSVHENFVKSRGFRKLLEVAMERIKSEPDMIYMHLKGVVDELKVRRKAKIVEEPTEEEPPVTPSPAPTPTDAAPASTSPPPQTAPPAASTGNKRLDERIRKLNRTLYTITKRIASLEEADVDWNDDDDSSYLQVERYKKRACQIYEKICDLTGESKSAHRHLKQPILFKDTPYPQFNRTLSAFVNRMHEFPDYHDVLQLLEHCNLDKDLGLARFEMKRIAHDAFVKVGRLLQARRKTDLYETVTHFTSNAKDPAATDAALLAKLNENNKKQTKISDILAKYAREQDLTAEEQREARLKEKQEKAAKEITEEEVVKISQNHRVDDDDDDKPCTSAQAAAKIILTNGNPPSNPQVENIEDEDEDEEEDSDSEEEDVDAFVDNFKANGELSDAESETEITPKTDVVIEDVTRRVKTAAPPEESLPNGKLKIMSVSSLNASVPGNGKPHEKIEPKEQKTAIAAEIIISDEES